MNRQSIIRMVVLLALAMTAIIGILCTVVDPRHRSSRGPRRSQALSAVEENGAADRSIRQMVREM